MTYSFYIHKNEFKFVFNDVKLGGFDIYTTTISISYLRGTDTIRSNLMAISFIGNNSTYLIPEGTTEISISIGFHPIEMEQYLTLEWRLY